MPYALDRPRLWFERRGTGEPLLVITGFAISSAIFDPVLDLYAQRFDCITYDHRGSGRSGKPPLPTSMAELASDAARLLDALEVPSAHVYGVSMGGMVAQELALRFPERVRGLILGCTSPGGPLAARPAVAGLAREGAVALRELAGGRHPLGPFLFSPEFRAREPELADVLLARFTDPPPWPLGATAQWWAAAFHDTVSRLGRIQAPALVFHGERDVLSPRRNAELLARRIPDAELAVVPGAGHAYALERPRESYELLVRWLDRRGPIGAGDPRGRVATTLEPVSRAAALPIAALRTSRSLGALVIGQPGARRLWEHAIGRRRDRG